MYEDIGSCLGDYFAGMNTGDGFRGIYPEIVNEDRLRRIFIIKGSSGSGKSTLMKKAASAAENLKYHVVRYLCSFDPTSLDAVVINDRVAIVDGTFPHMLDMKYPGVSSEIIDLTKFSNRAALESKRREIMEVTTEKSVEFARAVRSLGSFAALCGDIRSDIRSCINYDKATSAASSLIDSLLRKTSGSDTGVRSTLPVRGIGMRGRVKLGTLKKSAQTVIGVTDMYSSAYDFTEIVASELARRGIGAVYSCDPICTSYICDIFIPGCRILISTDHSADDDRNINMKRFIFPDRLRSVRGGIRLAHRCAGEILDDAQERLAKCGELHLKLERLYGEAMDFSALDAYGEEIIQNVLESARADAN